MSLTIYKYAVGPGPFDVSLPRAAKILTVQMQQGVAQMWVLLDPEAPKIQRRFRTAGTGHPINVSDPSQLDYIGTFQMDGGMLVIHLFEIKP